MRRLLRTRTGKDLIMNQEFDDDLSTPTEADLD